MEQLLFNESARDPAVYGTVAVALIIIAAAAGYVPARRASLADPMQALRAE